MSLSALDELRLILNSEPNSAGLRRLHQGWLEQWASRTTDVPSVLRQLSDTDIGACTQESALWLMEQLPQVVGADFETWGLLMAHLTPKDPTTLDRVFALLDMAQPVAKTQHTDMTASVLHKTLAKLNPNELPATERQRIVQRLSSLPESVLPFSGFLAQNVLNVLPSAWLVHVLPLWQQQRKPGIVKMEETVVGFFLRHINAKRTEALAVLDAVLPNLVSAEDTFSVRGGAKVENFAHSEDIMALVDTHLGWSEANKQKFLPRAEDFVKLLRNRVVPGADISAFTEQLFHYPFARVANADKIKVEVAHRFQVYLLCSLFLNTKYSLEYMVQALGKVPQDILQLTKDTPPKPIDLKMLHVFLAQEVRCKSFTEGFAHILNSKKRQGERQNMRAKIVDHLPETLRNAAELLMHLSAPNLHKEPKGECVGLAVPKDARQAYDKSDGPALQSAFLKHQLLTALGDMTASDGPKRKM